MKFILPLILISNIVFIKCQNMQDGWPTTKGLSTTVDSEVDDDSKENITNAQKEEEEEEEEEDDELGTSTRKAFDGYSSEDIKWRFLIFILIKRDKDFDHCTGSLIKEDLVLSSAHCFYQISLEPRDVILVGGRANLENYIMDRKTTDFYDFFNDEPYGTQSIRAKDISIPINYNNDTHFHDIALIKGEEPFSEEKTKIIPWNVGKMMHKKECSSAAFGMITGYPPKPAVGFIEVMDALPMNLKLCKGDPLAPLICVKTEDTGGCLEFSGGPLICQGHVWAVGSRAYYEGCKENKEVFYSALYIDREWLMSVYIESKSKETVASKMAVLAFSLNVILLCFGLIYTYKRLY